jgi:hypothetical protein
MLFQLTIIITLGFNNFGWNLVLTRCGTEID